MNNRALATLARLLTPVFVKLRLLQVLILCAVALLFIRLERLYNVSENLFVQGAKATQADTKPADKPTDKPAEKTPDKPADKPADKPGEKPANKPADASKSDFPKEKMAEGFKTESFDILELSPEQVEVLRTLSKRHRDLVQREKSISEREATLQAIEQRLDQKTEELKKIQEYLQQLLGQKSEKEQEALKKLVGVYEKMKPVEAANILQGLDLETLLNIMDEMKEAKVSAIVSKMEPLRARILTIELAQRRKKLEEKMQKEQEAAAQHPDLQPASAPAGPTANTPAPDVAKPQVPGVAPQPAQATPAAPAPTAPPAKAPTNSPAPPTSAPKESPKSKS